MMSSSTHVSNVFEEESIDLDSFEIPANAINELKPPTIEDQKTVASLRLKPWLGTQLQLQLFENGIIQIQRARQPVQLVRSGIIRMPPRQYYSLGNASIVMGMVLITGLGFLIFAQYIDYRVFAGLSFIVLLGVFIQAKLHIRFSTVGAGCAIFELKSSFFKKATIKAFAEKVQEYQSHCDLVKAPLPLLIQEHRRLSENNIISKQAYEIAKSRLFTMRKSVPRPGKQ